MKATDKKEINTNKHKAFITNAVTEIHRTEPESELPISSDNSVDDARDWGSEGSKL